VDDVPYLQVLEKLHVRSEPVDRANLVIVCRFLREGALLPCCNPIKIRRPLLQRSTVTPVRVMPERCLVSIAQRDLGGCPKKRHVRVVEGELGVRPWYQCVSVLYGAVYRSVDIRVVELCRVYGLRI
jgi:hypothetical protein